MARPLATLLFVLSASALIGVACNDGGDFLLDEPDATGTPSFFQRTPLPSPEPSPVGSPLAEGATPVAAPFQITADEAVNLRSEPTTAGGQATVTGTLDAGDTSNVTATIPGEEVETGNDVWYQLEDGSFVYSGAVKEVE